MFEDVNLNLSYLKYLNPINLEKTHRLHLKLPKVNIPSLNKSETQLKRIENFVSEIDSSCEVSLDMDMDYEMKPAHYGVVSKILDLNIQHISVSANQSFFNESSEEKAEVIDQIASLSHVNSLKVHCGGENYNLPTSKLTQAIEHVFSSDNDDTYESDFTDEIEIL